MTTTPDDGITLRQLRYLVAVADHGSFTAAAVELHVAQPSLSQQVRLLERAVGGPLLERTPRGARPTPAGTVFLPKARSALLAAADGARMARREVEEPGGVCLAVVPGAPNGLLAAAVARWRDAHPGAAVRWHEHPDARRVEEKLRDSPGVVAVSVDPGPASGPARRIALGTDPLVLVGPAHRSGESLPLATSGYEQHAPHRLTVAGLIEAPGTDGALALVRAGIARTIVPSSLVDGADATTAVEPLPELPPRSFFALLADAPTEAAAALGELLAEVAGRRGPRALDSASFRGRASAASPSGPASASEAAA